MPSSNRSDLDPESVEALLGLLLPAHHERLLDKGEIARGGMATIRVALDRALDRRVAVKLLRPDYQHTALAVRSFIREAQITGQLDHPNIVPVHELALDEREQLYFTMKLVEGRSLADLIDAVRSTHERADQHGTKIATAVDHEPLLRLLDVFMKVLDAVAFAHSRGVCHCDLKPENIMVGDYGQVYVMDWGIAKVLPPPRDADPLRSDRRIHEPLALRQPDRMIIGTPAYMSPEQARGDQRKVDARSDVFALGAMLFEILTGHPPYQGRTSVEVLLQAEDAQARLPEQLPIARELRRIVGVAMAADPDDRYPRVQDMQADLQVFMRGGGNFPQHRYAAGEWIIREDEVGEAAYILIAGRCEVLKQVDGALELLRILGPGDVFGETAILASTRRTASVRAVTEVVAVIVTADVLEREVDAMKPWMGAFIRALAQRFSESIPRRASDTSGTRPIPSRSGQTQPQMQAIRQPSARPLGAARPLAEPAQVANQAMMVLESWGKWDRDLGHSMALARLCTAVAATCGVEQSEVLTILRTFTQFQIEAPLDLISLRDKRGLVRELEPALKL